MQLTPKGLSRTLNADAEPPPSRPPPSSWDIHAGGLLWPELIGQRDRREIPKPAGEYAGGFFAFEQKLQQRQDQKRQDKT
jgi:hypothetical protein